MNQSLVEVTVGENDKAFTIHKDVLCAYSEYFRARLQRPWLDSEDKSIHLAGVDEGVMRLVQWWLYAQASRCTDVDPRAPPEDFMRQAPKLDPKKEKEYHRALDRFLGPDHERTGLITRLPRTTLGKKLALKHPNSTPTPSDS
jgi:hypothetical protein